MTDTPQTPRKKRFTLTNTQILLIPILIFGGILVLDFRQRVIEGQEKIAETEAIANQIALLEAEQRRLEAAKAYYNSDAYVEAWAHSQGKMVKPGEILVVPVTGDEAPLVVAVPPTTPALVEDVEPLAPWRIWWSLFFDTDPPFTSNSESAKNN